MPIRKVCFHLGNGGPRYQVDNYVRFVEFTKYDLNTECTQKPESGIQITSCSELRCIRSYLAIFYGLKSSILGTQSPKHLREKGITNWFL